MRASLLVTVIVVTVLGAGIASTARDSKALAAQGDPVAKAEVIAAFDKLNSMPSYRMKTSAPGGTTMIEVVRPDRSHYTAQSPNGTFESITIGTQTAERVSMPGRPTGWRCTTNRRPLDVTFSLDRMRADLTEVVRKPDGVIEGMPVHTYAAASGSGATLYIGVQTGLPRRLAGVDKRTGKITTIDFYDYGAPITITLPPCG